MFNFLKKKNESDIYKFSLPKNTICFTCEHVFEEGKDILYVSHDVDGDWQFMCGEINHEPENGKLICLEHAIKLDSTLNEIAEIPKGYIAERKNHGEKWEIYE